MLVLHYTGMQSASHALDRLIDPSAKVSAHYVVDELGQIYQMVPEEKRAWHAGLSSWRAHTNINQRSIGIEMVNPGHQFGYRPFPNAQMRSVIELSKTILQRHAIPARNVVGHSDIAPIRKQDPGELFDWKWLAEEGIGLWPNRHPERSDETQAGENPSAVPQDDGLARFGYDTSDLTAAIIAFQRRFRPENVAGNWDSHCAKLLAALLESV